MKKWMISAVAVFAALMLFPMPALAANQKIETENTSGIIDQMKQLLKAALKNFDEETIGEIISFVKEKEEQGMLDSEENLQSVIEEGEEKFQVAIDKDSARKLVATMEKLEKMGFSMEYIIEKAENLYEEHGADFVDHIDEIVTGAVKNAAGNVANSFIEGIKSSVKNFFQNLFR